jgi:serine/threonine-protein kinase
MKLCPTCKETYAVTLTYCPRDGEVLQETPESFVGRVIDGKYRVEGFIAQGGMGAVYRARHILLGDEVVIKTLRAEMRNNAEWLKRFQREGKAARAFRHPNAVTVYDLSSGSDGQVYMVMEYVEGQTLARELKRRGRFSPLEALAILEPVADVLDAAHARGVVHRDLKPENIMLGGNHCGHTVVKVLDLGIAKMVGTGDVHAAEATSLTVAGQILGTPYYMSPEQWGEMPRDGEPEVDRRTDVYSLGVIFFELVAGKKPLGGRSLSELRQQHVDTPPPDLCEYLRGIPTAFSRSVAHAMAKDRADRPQTAGALIDEVRAALNLPPLTRGGESAHAARTPGEDAGESATLPLIAKVTLGAVAAERSESGKLYEKPRARRRRVVLALACGTLFAALLLGFAGWYRWRDEDSAREGIATPSITTEASPAEAPRVEVMSYWFEVKKFKDDIPSHVAEVAPKIASGKFFRLHFRSPSSGYLYIVGPNQDGNARTAIFTAIGGGSRGDRLRTNQMLSDADFVVPYLKLNEDTGTEEYVVIFSPKLLSSPAFLLGKAEQELTPAELIEFDEFRARYVNDAPVLAERGEGKERVVAVSLPEANAALNHPIIFGIRLEHK